MKRSTSLLLCLVACAPTTGNELPLRPGVAQVYEGPAIDDGDCLFRTSEPGVCPTWVDLDVRDVVRDGDRVVVLLNLASPFSLGVALVFSEDLGASWRSVVLGSPPAGAGAGALQLVGDSVIVHWVGSMDGSLGGRPVPLRWELPFGTRSTSYASPNTDTLLISQLVPSIDGRARTFAGPVDLNDGASGFWEFSWAPTDAAPRAVKRCAGVMGCLAPTMTPDGLHFVRVFDRGSPTATGFQKTEGCVYRSSPDRVACAPWRDWAASADTGVNDDVRSTVVVDGPGQYDGARLWVRGGHTWLQRLHPFLPGRLAPALDLGPGRPTTNTGAAAGDTAAYAGAKQRFRGFTAVLRPDNALSFFRARGLGGLDEAQLPNSPCAKLSDCGDVRPGVGQATWALPLEGDEHLVFYVVDTFIGETANHQYLMASRERVGFRELEPEARDLSSRYPGSRPPTALEATCLRAASCFPQAALAMHACAQWWSAIRTSAPGAQAALDRFLATPAGCAGFSSSWPELAVASRECRVQGCTCTSDLTGLFTCAEDAPCGVACTRRGGTCLADGQCSLRATAAECDQCTADGRAVACFLDTSVSPSVKRLSTELLCAAGGSTCQTCTDGSCSAACLQTARCPTDGTRCEGAVAVTCDRGSEQRIDCASTGQACDSMRGCVPPPGGTRCAALTSSCEGSSVVDCLSPSQVWVVSDCAALGFSRCVQDSTTTTARCQ